MENITYGMSNRVASIDLKVGYWLYNELDEAYNKNTTAISAMYELDPYYFTVDEAKNKEINKTKKMKWRMTNTMIKSDHFVLSGLIVILLFLVQKRLLFLSAFFSIINVNLN